MSNVTAKVIRDWARENMDSISDEGKVCLNPSARGRLHPDVLAAYGEAHGEFQLDPTAPTKTPEFTVSVMVPWSKGDRSGKAPRKVTLTVQEARELTGTPRQRGRISEQTKVDAAYAKLGVERPAE